MRNCVDCGKLIECGSIPGHFHRGRINQCDPCGGKREVETVIGVPIADGKSDYGVQIGKPSRGYGKSLAHSQKKLA